MSIQSLGYRTDLFFSRLSGEVTDNGEYLCIRTPSNPTYWWGNYLLFKRAPRLGDAPHGRGGRERREERHRQAAARRPRGRPRGSTRLGDRFRRAHAAPRIARRVPRLWPTEPAQHRRAGSPRPARRLQNPHSCGADLAPHTAQRAEIPGRSAWHGRCIKLVRLGAVHRRALGPDTPGPLPPLRMRREIPRSPSK